MNRVAIFGGLGNQMFQYALAIVMEANGIPTKISVTEYLLNRHHQGFELLKAFNVPIPIRDRIKVFAISRARQVLVNVNTIYFRQMLTKILHSGNNIFHEAKEYTYDKRVFEQENSFLIGTWQCIKYFESQKELIREVFNFNKPGDTLNLRIANEIQSKNSIAVHVRRGDFTTPGMSNSRMVIDSNSYYDKAIELMNMTIENPVFYIFSDDITWAKQRLKGSNIVFISHNTGSNSYLDMYLMSLCKHFVIANSSFSWWAAWLAENKDKKVFMPRPWVKNADCSGLYPSGWSVLEANPSKVELV